MLGIPILVPTGLWVRASLGPEVNLEAGFQNGAYQHQYTRDRMSFQKCLLAVSMPQSELQLPLDSPGNSPRSAGRCETGSFQITASAKYLKAVRFCVLPLRVESLFPQLSGSPESKFCWSSKPSVLGACVPGTGSPRLGV